MTKLPRPPEEVDKVREKILENALSIIIEKGYNELTMRGLAAKSRMSATNLYNYFSNKDEIYLSIVIKGNEKLYNQLKIANKAHDDDWQRAQAMLKCYLDFGINDSHYYNAVFNKHLQGFPRVHEFIGTPSEKLALIELDYSQKIAELTEQVIKEYVDIANEEQTRTGILLLWSILHGLVSLYNSNLARYITPDPEKLYKNVIDQLLVALADGFRALFEPASKPSE